MDYATFKAIVADLLAASVKASAALRAIPGVGSGPMGLTPDSVKALPAYREARAAYDHAAARLRAFNGAHAARFKAEIRADIEARRKARLPA